MPEIPGELLITTITVITGVFLSLPTIFCVCSTLDCIRDKDHKGRKIVHTSTFDANYRASQPEIIDGIVVKPEYNHIRNLTLNGEGIIFEGKNVHPSTLYGVGRKYPSRPGVPVNQDGTVDVFKHKPMIYAILLDRDRARKRGC